MKFKLVIRGAPMDCRDPDEILPRIKGLNNITVVTSKHIVKVKNSLATINDSTFFPG